MTAPSTAPAGPQPIVANPSGSTPDAPWASSRSQVAVFAVAAGAMGIVCAALDHPGWGILAATVLAVGVGLGLGVGAHRLFRSLPATVAGVFAALGTIVLLLAVWSGDLATAPWGVVPLVWVLLVGMDWVLAARLRSLPFVFGLLVVAAVLGEQPWTFAAAVVWLALALGSLASLEADRRAAQPATAPMTPGAPAPDVRAGDLVTTVLIALAIALVAALVLSTPSCHLPNAGDRFGDLGSDLGGREPGGTGESGGSGTSGGSGGTTGSGELPRQYVPNADGTLLVPNDGAGGTSGNTRIPVPDDFQGTGPNSTTLTQPDGSTITYQGDGNGNLRATVDSPGQPTRTFEYRQRPDGLTEIRELDQDGKVVKQYLYDPTKQAAADAEGSTGGALEPSKDGSTGQAPADQPDEKDDDAGRSLHVNGWILAAVIGLLLAVAALVYLLRRRPDPTIPVDAPPWALRLARQIEDAGRRRGRPRRRSEPLVTYTAALRDGVLPDERLDQVGAIVSAGLYADVEPGPEQQQWAAEAIEQITTDHPVPSRADRRRTEADSSSR